MPPPTAAYLPPPPERTVSTNLAGRRRTRVGRLVTVRCGSSSAAAVDIVVVMLDPCVPWPTVSPTTGSLIMSIGEDKDVLVSVSVQLAVSVQ